MTAFRTVLLCFVATWGLGTAPATGASPQDPTPEELFAEGLGFLQTRDWTAAVARFEAVLEADPESLPTWINLATALAGAGNDDQAIGAYRRVLSLDPGIFEARRNLAILLQREGRLSESLAEATGALELRPEDSDAALHRAELLDQLGQPEEAARAYEAVIALAPSSERPHRRLGILLRREGHTDGAYDAFLEAARLGSEDAGVFVSLGDIAAERQDYDAARVHYRRAVEIAGEIEGSADVRLRLALVLSELEDYAEAIPLLEGLEDVGPLLAETYLLAGRPADARGAYQRLVREFPDEPDYWHGLGRADYELGMTTEALGPLAEATRLDPERVAAWGLMGGIYYQNGNFEEATVMLLRRLELLPGDALTHFMLGTAFDNLQNSEAALLHYNQFLELDDGSNDARTFQVQQRRELLERVRD